MCSCQHEYEEDIAHDEKVLLHNRGEGMPHHDGGIDHPTTRAHFESAHAHAHQSQ